LSSSLSALPYTNTKAWPTFSNICTFSIAKRLFYYMQVNGNCHSWEGWQRSWSAENTAIPRVQDDTKVSLTAKFLPELVNEMCDTDWQKWLKICQDFLPIPRAQRICNGSGDAHRYSGFFSCSPRTCFLERDKQTSSRDLKTSVSITERRERLESL
jgi:hypothetical protein